MEMKLKRVQLGSTFTLGRLTLGGPTFECWVCEDRVRPVGEPKVHGETAIPAGRYEVQITWSPRFKRKLPLLLNVPGFEGIRIHPGNTAKDTEGCLLPGLDRLAEGVGRSVLAFNALYAELERAEIRHEAVFITIE